jgi:RHS repeat-associated protein
MPATLPATSAYTYAVDFSADEAVAAGATQVTFTPPIISYTENFRNFAVGGNVPVGYYDSARAAWIPSANGRVLQILARANGLAELDVAGHGVPADAAALAALGITDAERQQLAVLYQPGQSLWRVTLSHFSPYDPNWGVGWPPDATPPDQPDPTAGLPDDPCTQAGSIIECQTQVLGEMVPITGTPFTLHYQSDRVPGRRDLFTLDIPLSGPQLPKSIVAITYAVEVAGRRLPDDPNVPNTIAGNWSNLANQSRSVTWDGKDAYGHLAQGRQLARVLIGYVYPCVYSIPANFGAGGGGGQASVVGTSTNCTIVLWQVHRSFLGAWNALPQGLGGWSLTVHHAYDPVGQVLYLGNGGRRSAAALSSVITTVAGGGSSPDQLGDGGPATQALLRTDGGVAFAPDGSMYIADSAHNRIRMVDPNGIITTVAGGLNGGFGGDGGPAIAAQLNAPYDVAVGPDGSLYIADALNHRIRHVGLDGRIATVAGNGNHGYAGDGGPATAATLNFPSGVDVGPDGSVYIADNTNSRIRRIGTGGIITTVAGNGAPGFGPAGDGGPATQAKLGNPWDVAIAGDGSLYIADTNDHVVRRVRPDGIIVTFAGSTEGYDGDGGLATAAKLDAPTGVAVGLDGSVYIADSRNKRVRRVTPNGIITTVAGTGTNGSASCAFEDYCGDGGPATAAQLVLPRRVAIGPEGNLYILNEANSNRVLRVASALPELSFTDLAVPAEDGNELYFFNALGRHMSTLDLLTGTVRYEFAYDSAGRLTQVIDKQASGNGNITTIQHDAQGNPTAIIGPFGQHTALTVHPNGYLASLTNPAGETFSFTYNGGAAAGLLASFTNPRGKTSTFAYDALGRLTKDTDAAGGFHALSRINQNDGWTVTLSTATGTTTQYQIEQLSTGAQQRTNTSPSGLQTVTQIGTDGTRTLTSPDGVTTTLTRGPDPRFGMLAPLLQSLSITTPGGKHSSLTTSRSVTLTDPNDALSLTSQTDIVTINGLNYTSTFDAASKTITSKTPSQRQTITTLDYNGRMVEVAIDSMEPIKFTYDTKGQPDTMTQGTRVSVISYNLQGSIASVTDPLNRTTAFAYDSAGRVTTQTLPDGRQVGYTYDANGNVSSITPPGRPSHSFHFTSIDLLEDYSPPDVGLATEATQYSYDLDRHLTLVTRPDGATIGFAYDSAGRLSTIATSGRTVSYTYASANGPTPGTLAKISASDGVTLTYGYDGSLMTDVTWSGPVSGTIHGGYDNNFRIASEMVNNEPAISFVYDNDGLLTQAGSLTLSRNAENGLVIVTTLGSLTDTFTYNQFAEVTDYTAEYAGAARFSVQRQQDALGRLTQKTESIDGEAPQTYTYQYDTAGRLTDVSVGGTPMAHYTYDQNSNRLSYTGPSGTLTGSYDNQDRLLSYGNATYTYMANGELQSKTQNGQITTYHYDVLGNLTAVTLPSGAQIAYVIDGNNRRIGKKVNGMFVQGFLYHSMLKPVAELDGNGQVVTQFIYAERSNVPVCMLRNGVTYRILSDHLGSPRLVLDVATGVVAQRLDYDEFGRVLQDTNPGFQPFGFAGGLYDPDTGLVRFGARDYDAETGRWIAKDPLRFAGEDLNLYGYVLSDPINFTDPTGLSWLSILGNFVLGVEEGIIFGVVVATFAASGPIGIVAAAALTGYGGYSLGNAGIEIVTGRADGGLGRHLYEEERLDMGARLAGGIVGSVLAERGYSSGKEFCLNRDSRIAPFGNRTGNDYGEFPHYHRKVADPDNPGASLRDQGIKRHRPWQKGDSDTSFWDRF